MRSQSSRPLRPAGLAAPGFTIIELLVVVAILGLLIAILLPAVNKVRDQAKVTESESNLRQMGAAHVNYADPAHLAVLQGARVSVAYCPRASVYFGHVEHPYRVMLEAGVNVALGTDGLPCLDTPDRISVLDEMRLLARRGGVTSRALLAMGTVNGAVALGFDPARVTLAPGVETAGVLAVPIDAGSGDPLDRALHGTSAPEWLASSRDEECVE